MYSNSLKEYLIEREFPTPRELTKRDHQGWLADAESATSFLDETLEGRVSSALRAHCILNDITQVPICSVCGEGHSTTSKKAKDGYHNIGFSGACKTACIKEARKRRMASKTETLYSANDNDNVSLIDDDQRDALYEELKIYLEDKGYPGAWDLKKVSHREAVGKLKEATSFLDRVLTKVPNTTRAYCVVNGITEVPKCMECGDPISKPGKNFEEGELYSKAGFREFCSKRCASGKSEKESIMVEEIKGSYLTEFLLGEALKEIFPGIEFVHNKRVPDSGIRNRPDFRSDDLMLIVEFDGNRHFQDISLMFNDTSKDVTYSMMGYEIVRIPYFVQLSSETIKHYFGKSIEWDQIYPHGFIDEKAVLPQNFSRNGYIHYHNVLNELPAEVAKEIYKTEVSRFLEICNMTMDLDVSSRKKDREFVNAFVPWFE